MNDKPDTSETLPQDFLSEGNDLLVQKAGRTATYFIWPVIIIAMLVLTGWQFNIEFFKRPLPRLTAMNPATAVLFALSAIALLLLKNKDTNPASKRTGYSIAILVIALATLRIIDLIVAFDIPVDHILFRQKMIADAPGNVSNDMAANTAICFILTGISLLWLHKATKKGKMISQYLSLAIASLALFSIIGYVYQVQAFYGILTYLPMAIHSALCFLLLSLALLFTTAGKGFMKELTGNFTGSVTARPLIIVAIVIPLLLGWARLLGEWAHLYSLEFGSAMLAIGLVIAFLWIIWNNTIQLNRRDVLKREADRALKKAEEQVQTIFDAAPEAIIVMDETGTVIKWNPKAESLLGWKQHEVVGKLLSEIAIPQRLREAYKNGMAHFLKTGEGLVPGEILETHAITKHGKEIDIALNIALSSGIKEHMLFIGFIRDLTGRKIAEAKFKSLLDSAPDAMIITDEKGEIVLINRQTENLFEYTRDDLIGKPIEILIPPEFRDKHVINRAQYYGKPRARSMGAGLELFGIKKGGMRFPVEISLSPLVAEEGTLISAAIRDITSRKKEEERLKSLQKDFALLVSSVKDYAIFLLDKDGKVESWNSGAEHIKGYAAKEIIGKSMEVFYTAEELANNEPKENLKKALRYGHYECEGYRVRKDGSLFYADVSFTALLDDEGKLYGYAKVTRDITEKRKTEERMRFLALIADNILDPVISADNEFKITRWNEAAEKLFEWKSDEVTGKVTNEVLRVEHPYQTREEILQAFSKRGYWQGEVIYYTKSGKALNVFVTVSQMKDANGNSTGSLVLARDITDRKNAEIALSRLNAELEERVADRTEALRKSEAFNVGILNSLSSHIAVLDSSGDIVTVNKSWKRFAIENGDASLIATGVGNNYYDVCSKSAMENVSDAESALEGIKDVFDEKTDSFYLEYPCHSPTEKRWFALRVAKFENKEPLVVISHQDISQRKKAEKQIEETLDEKNSILESIGDAFFAVDKKWTVTYWNRVAERDLAMSKTDVVGKNLWDVFTDSIDSISYKKYYRALETGHIVHFEDYYPALNRWYEISAYPSENGLSVFFKDVTEKKIAAEKIKESEYRYRSLIEQASDSIFIFNAASVKYMDINPAGSLLTGYTREEFLKLSPKDLSLEEYPEASALNKDDLKKCKPINYERRLKRKDGTTVEVEVSAKMMDDDKVVIFARDITERKRTAEKIIESEKLYRSIYENTGEAILFTKPDGSILSANGIACKIFERTEEEICRLGRNGLVNLNDQRVVPDLIERENSGLLRSEWTFLKKDGSLFPGEVSSTLFKNSEGEERTITIIRDITERKNVEDKIRNINMELERKVLQRTEQLQAANSEMEAFSYSVSHDLRAPLRGIIGFTTILEEDYVSQLDDEARRVTAVIKSNTAKMGNLIDDLLAFSRMGRKTVEKTTIDTGELVKEIVAEFENKSKGKVDWQIASLPNSIADITTIKQVWVNLISNAVKYSGKRDQPKIEIGSKKDHHATIFFVKDNGVGFDEKYKQKLFKVFQRLHSAAEFEGTGVGLAIVEKIISKHGGNVWAEAELNKGACFYFSLPA